MNAARNIILSDSQPSPVSSAFGGEEGATPSNPPLEELSFDSLQTPFLSAIDTPAVLQQYTKAELVALAAEIRAVLCRLSECRSVHFASNLGVVELAIALHSTLDFSHDRLIWDTGHQCYPHKLLTGRYRQFDSLRTLGGLMGYPNPGESAYDLFMTGHAGCSVGAALGMSVGDGLLRADEDRHAVAVIGDGALAAGPVFEALNHAGGLRQNITVILNDNKMSICRRVGGLGRTLDRLRMAGPYLGLKRAVHRVIDSLPSFGRPAGRVMASFKDAIKAGLVGGMLFEEFGFRYIGPIDGHDISSLKKYLCRVRAYREPVLLHVLTEKGCGYAPAEEDPASFHAPMPEVIQLGGGNPQTKPTISPSLSSSREVLPVELVGEHSYTHWVRDAVGQLMRRDARVCVITAAMTQGNMLEPLREEFSTRFFDVGISESHAVVFAAGLAKSGMRPVVDIYSTFLQRAYDHLFQEASLANLPITFLLDRAGIVGADGPTHHGVFDIPYTRHFPNFCLLAPGHAADVLPMIEFAVRHDGPVAIRYPKATASRFDGAPIPISFGQAQTLRTGSDGVLVACGEQVAVAMAAAESFAQNPPKERLDIGVVNARFLKPFDTETILAPLRDGRFLLTAEEGMLAGGFGSAVLEAAVAARLDTGRIVRMGIGDAYVEHGSRDELLAAVGLDLPGMIRGIENVSRPNS